MSINRAIVSYVYFLCISLVMYSIFWKDINNVVEWQKPETSRR